MPGLIRYDAACKAIAKAKAVDEVKKIRNASEAMRAYARQAKNKQLEIDAAEIRIRAERRIGELMREQNETVGLNRGTAGNGRPKKGGSNPNPPKDSRPTLAQVGIDKKLADRARKYAAVPDDEWEEELEDWRSRVAEEGKRVRTKLEQRGESEIRRTTRKECDIPESAVVDGYFSCPTCGQRWPEGRPIS